MPLSQRAISAATKGPEAKKVKIKQSNSSKRHEFNIKPVSYRYFNQELTIFGQISHCLKLRKDDQIWFTFNKKGSQLTPSNSNEMIVELEDGGFVETLVMLKPIGIAIGDYFGVDANKYFDMIKSHQKDFDFVDLDNGWKKAVSYFLDDLSKQITKPRLTQLRGLKFFKNTNMKGKSISIRVGQDIKHMKSLKWNDIASSLVASIPINRKLEIYRGQNFTSRKLELGPGYHIIRDLSIHGFGDAITSLRWKNSTVGITR